MILSVVSMLSCLVNCNAASDAIDCNVGTNAAVMFLLTGVALRR